MAVQLRAAYYKTNLAWPLLWSSPGLRTVMLAKRYETAVRQLLMTPIGSLYADPGYGTTIYRLRGQPLNPGKIGVMLAQLRDACGKYIPDIQVIDLQAKIDQDEEKLQVLCVWIIRNATAQSHGKLAGQKATTVLI